MGGAFPWVRRLGPALTTDKREVRRRRVTAVRPNLRDHGARSIAIAQSWERGDVLAVCVPGLVGETVVRRSPVPGPRRRCSEPLVNHERAEISGTSAMPRPRSAARTTAYMRCRVRSGRRAGGISPFSSRPALAVAAPRALHDQRELSNTRAPSCRTPVIDGEHAGTSRNGNSSCTFRCGGGVSWQQ